MLTDAACKDAKPREKAYKLCDEKGLYLEVMPNGSKYFRQKPGSAERKSGVPLECIRKRV